MKYFSKKIPENGKLDFWGVVSFGTFDSCRTREIAEAKAAWIAAECGTECRIVHLIEDCPKETE